MYNSNTDDVFCQQIKSGISHSNRLVFASKVKDDVQEAVGRMMKPHSLVVTDNKLPLNANMYHLRIGDISFSRLQYGASVAIEPDCLGDFYLVQMPLNGLAEVDDCYEKIHSGPQLASVLSPYSKIVMNWQSGTDQFLVKIPKPLIERTITGILGYQIEQPLRFDLGFHWQNSRQWRSLLPSIIDFASNLSSTDNHNKLIAAQLDQLITTCLLSAHHHNYTSLSSDLKTTNVRPRHVRYVQEYIEAHINESLTPEYLANIAGVSLRSLYSGFKDFLGVSPMQYLRDIRMDKVRNDILSGQAQSVTGVAMKWGFTHMGRFSCEYKKRFNETPRETLRSL
ncbi:AraC family transcriptional regulator [Veronia pacifica]|uniref:Transcriptional regulator n=1 Tax=Veronia pacifica TaxID=1080227 RepID=A0A1C3ECD5_9GAMM|nr:AraC family transcriptional regulator [Veronia pacifica]ODA30898.1 transcriptional regulator [Veronia pacifica]